MKPGPCIRFSAGPSASKPRWHPVAEVRKNGDSPKPYTDRDEAIGARRRIRIALRCSHNRRRPCFDRAPIWRTCRHKRSPYTARILRRGRRTWRVRKTAVTVLGKSPDTMERQRRSVVESAYRSGKSLGKVATRRMMAVHWSTMRVAARWSSRRRRFWSMALPLY